MRSYLYRKMYRKVYSKAGQRLIDAIIVGAAFYLGYQLRFAGQVAPAEKFQLSLLVVPVAVLRVLINSLWGVYRYQWRYVSVTDAIQIARVYFVLSLALLGCRLFLPEQLQLLRIPVTVIAIEFALSLLGTLGVRLLRRLLYERQENFLVQQRICRLLLVGAGSHGVAVAKEMVGRKGIKIVGFVDDDPQKAGAIICGLPVLGPTASLSEISRIHNVDEILVCIPPALRSTLKLGKNVAASDGLTFRSRIVPTINEILDIDPDSILPLIQPNGKRPKTNEPPTPGAPRIQGKTVLITGGAGFIGSSLAEKLAADNRVMLLDVDFRGRPIEFTSLMKHPNVRIIEGNLLNTSNLRKLAADADIVVHAAAIVGVGRVCNSGRQTLETNYTGTSRLLEALEKNHRLERFIYFSTSEVFGVNSFRVDEKSPPTIGSIAEARWSYAIAKLAGEHLVKSYHREIRTPVVIVRPFNIFGPRRTGDHALLRFIMSSLCGQPIEVHGDGSQIRSWCYIEDFCTALLEMIVRPEAIGEDFNIGHPGNTLTIYELARKVLELTGAEVPIVLLKSPFPDIEIRVPSLSKAQSLLGFDPRYDLNSALRLTIQWYRENKTRIPALGQFAQLGQVESLDGGEKPIPLEPEQGISVAI